MKQDYDEAGIGNTLREVLAEFGFKPKTEDDCEEYDVSDEDRDGGPLTPTVVTGSDPIGVAIVSDKPVVTAARGALAFQSTKTIVGTIPQMLVGKDKRRRTVIIKNLSTSASIALDTSASVKFGGAGNFGSGELPAGDALWLDTSADIWSIAGEAVEVSVFQVIDDGM
jgi:hypothetical protein